MTAGVADDARTVIGRDARIGTIAIVSGAARRMWAGGWRTLALWVVIGGLGWAMQAGAKAAGVTITGAALEPGYFAYLLVSAVVSGLGAALALCLFVRGPGDWLKLDRGVLLCVAAMAGVTLAFVGVSQISLLFARSSNPGTVMTGSLVFMVLYLGAVFVVLKLNLWPVGLAMGRKGFGPGEAWRRMRKATRGLLLGYLIYMIPFGVAMAGNWADFSAGRSPQGWAQGLFLMLAAAYGIAGYAMSATIYALRVENPATVADVFD